MKNVKYKSIEEAISDGFLFHVFRSGGGLRVCTLTLDKKKFYGEGADLDYALNMLLKDCKKGGRSYEKVYMSGENSHYLTGSYAVGDCSPDDIVCSGKSIDSFYANGVFESVIDLKSLRKTMPKIILDKVHKGRETIIWKFASDQSIFISKPEQIPNGEIGCTTSALVGDMRNAMDKVGIVSGLGDDLKKSMVDMAVNYYDELKKEDTWFQLPDAASVEIYANKWGKEINWEKM